MMVLAWTLLIPFLTGDTRNSYAQEEKYVLVGTWGTIASGYLSDGHHVSYDENLKAVWDATRFAAYSNGTIAFNMTFSYLQPNPTTSEIYNGTSGRYENVTTAGDLVYRTSIVITQVSAWYRDVGFGDFVGEPLTNITAIPAKNVDNQTSSISFGGTFEIPKDKPHFDFYRYEIQLSWLRVFEDDGGNRYYQWMQGNANCGLEDCKSQTARIDSEYETLSGSLVVSMPIPESITGTQNSFDYVTWINENVDMTDIPEFSSLTVAVMAISVAGVIVWLRIGNGRTNRLG
jgi:hypothetical protein